jgi:hypothetical protein
MNSPADAAGLRSGLKVACLLGLTVVSPLCPQGEEDAAATEWLPAVTHRKCDSPLPGHNSGGFWPLVSVMA